MAGNRGSIRCAIVKADLSGMDDGLAMVAAGVERLSKSGQVEFARRYDALSMAGAEWVEVIARKDAVAAVLTHDMRAMCAEFGIVV